LVLAIPTITLVLAFTAIPLERRPPGPLWSELLETRLESYDVAVNVIGYVPIGAALATRTAWPAVSIVAAVSGFAETTQIFASGRAPSVLDLATNVFGAFVGWFIASRWRVLPPRLSINSRRAFVASLMALSCIAMTTQVTPREVEDSVTAAARKLIVLGLSVNDRGAEVPGALEAHWTFDEASGVLVNGPTVVSGVNGRAVHLDGARQYADFQSPVSLRLTGSMTVSAWINASAFPSSDAVIVSNYGGLGYQLDTTVDQGPRTVAFRFTNSWGKLTSRYGATPLQANTWYHVAGVLDADARTLSVFLDGQQDNGCLAGTVTTRQTVSPDHIYVGRPARPEGFSFAGLIDDVRIYSRALSQEEIQNDMGAGPQGVNSAQSHRLESSDSETACRSTEPADSRTAGLIVAVGLLVAVVCVGLLPWGNYKWVCVGASLLVGVLITPAVISKVPAYPTWLIPLLTLAGGAAVVLSTRSVDAESIAGDHRQQP
jgi:VanZ family protein